MQTRSFWVVRNRRHQDYVYRSPDGVKLRFASQQEARPALDEAMERYPREGWEIVELQSYLDPDAQPTTTDGAN